MSTLSNERNLFFQTDDFFNYPTFVPNTLIKGSSVSTEYLPNNNEKKIESGNYLVSFSSKTEDHCIGIVDMVDSTIISARLGSEKMSRYYQIFLNSMSKIINRFDGKVIKNIGDCLLYYFPPSENENQEKIVSKGIECSQSMIESHDFICRQLHKENLPCLKYRISMDYGKVLLMKSSGSPLIDMIGTTINMCSKINHSAPPNKMVVGGDMYEIVKKGHKYKFKHIEGFSVGLKLDYPTYLVHRHSK